MAGASLTGPPKSSSSSSSSYPSSSQPQPDAFGGAAAPSKGNNGGRVVRGLVLKALCLLGGALLIRKLTKSTTRWDHARNVAQALSGEKFTTEQAARDPMSYFNLRLLSCPATSLADGSRVLYFEQAFWRTPEKPYRQRFLTVKPCPKEMKCDVEVASYAIRDVEEYRNFCDRPDNHRPQPEEVVGDIAEHLTTIYLSRCERGRRCLYAWLHSSWWFSELMEWCHLLYFGTCYLQEWGNSFLGSWV